MTNDQSMVRLLYAILSQKCLKDIDWNQIARDPVLSLEITNGHAARMRYSRFKKQMEGTAGVTKKQRNPASPRKSRVEKKKSLSKRQQISAENVERIDGKAGEVGDRGGSSQKTVSAVPDMSEIPVMGLGLGLSMDAIPNPNTAIKRESSVPATHATQYPLMPNGSHDPSETLCPGYVGAREMHDMDEMMASFGMPDQGIYHHSTSMTESDYGHSIGMHMGLGGPYEGLWQQHPHSTQGNANIMVKTEPGWDRTYRSRRA